MAEVVIATPGPPPVDHVMQLKVKPGPRFIASLARKAENLSLNLCQGNLRPAFIEESLQNADQVFASMDKRVRAFMTTEVKDDALLITTLCAEPGGRLGTQLLNLATVLAQKLRKPKLRLDAVEESIGFYESRGFKRGATCNEGECILERAVYLPGGRRKTRRRTKSRR